jgi:hypothetical protein
MWQIKGNDEEEQRASVDFFGAGLCFYEMRNVIPPVWSMEEHI